MPTPRGDAAAVHLPGLGVLVVGGVRKGGNGLRRAELLPTPSAGGSGGSDGDNWRAIAPMIKTRSQPIAIHSGGRVLVADGYDENTLEELSLSAGQPGQWTLLSTRPSLERCVQSMCVFNGRILLAGELTELN